MRYSSRWAAGILAALVAVVTLALPAIADTVVNSITAQNPALFAAPGSITVDYTLNATGPNNSSDPLSNCNATSSLPVTLTIAPPAGLTASVGSVSFTSCPSIKSVTYSAIAPGIYQFAFSEVAGEPTNFTVSGGRSGGKFDLTASTDPIFAYNLESFTVNPDVDPLNCTGIVTDTWEGGTVCARIFPIPNSVSATGGLTFDFVAPGGAVAASIVGLSGTGNRSVATYRPTSCGAWTTVVRKSVGGTVLDTDTFDVVGCDVPPELTVPGDITVDTNSPSGAAVTFSATATDRFDGTLAPTCAPASGSVFPVGTTEVACSVTDSHGNTTTGSFDVTVDLYQASFEAPIDTPSVVNVAKVGRVIPIKAAVSMNGSAVMTGPVTLAIRSWAGCGTGAVDGIETFAPAGSSNEGNAFRWADGRWMYNLDTSGLAPGCYQGQVLTDGHLAGWFLIRLAR